MTVGVVDALMPICVIAPLLPCRIVVHNIQGNLFMVFMFHTLIFAAQVPLPPPNLFYSLLVFMCSSVMFNLL